MSLATSRIVPVYVRPGRSALAAACATAGPRRVRRTITANWSVSGELDGGGRLLLERRRLSGAEDAGGACPGPGCAATASLPGCREPCSFSPDGAMSSAWTVMTYLCGPCPGGGAAPRSPWETRMVPPWMAPAEGAVRYRRPPLRQRRDVGGDVQYGPVPETAAPEDVVDLGDCIALGAGRGAAPSSAAGIRPVRRRAFCRCAGQAGASGPARRIHYGQGTPENRGVYMAAFTPAPGAGPPFPSVPAPRVWAGWRQGARDTVTAAAREAWARRSRRVSAESSPGPRGFVPHPGPGPPLRTAALP